MGAHIPVTPFTLPAQMYAIERATTERVSLRRGRGGSRWFQLENGGQEAAPRSTRRGTRPKRLQYDDMDSDDSVELSDIAEGEEDEQEEGEGPEQEQVQSPGRGGGYDSTAVDISESDDEAPSQFSTPLKTAYSRRASSTGQGGTISPCHSSEQSECKHLFATWQDLHPAKILWHGLLAWPLGCAHLMYPSSPLKWQIQHCIEWDMVARHAEM